MLYPPSSGEQSRIFALYVLQKHLRNFNNEAELSKPLCLLVLSAPPLTDYTRFCSSNLKGLKVHRFVVISEFGTYFFVHMAFTDSSLTKLPDGHFDPPPDKIVVNMPVDGVTSSKEKQIVSTCTTDPALLPQILETNRLQNTSMPNKLSHVTLRTRSYEQPNFQQNARQSIHSRRSSIYKGGNLPFIGESCEAVLGNSLFDQPEMTERYSPSDGEEQSKLPSFATFTSNHQIRYRTPKPLLTIARGHQPANSNILSPTSDPLHDSGLCANQPKESNIRAMAMLGRSENSLNTSTADTIFQPPETSISQEPKSTRPRALSICSVERPGVISRNDSWIFSRLRHPRLKAAYSTPTLNHQNSSGVKMRRPESFNSNETYSGQQENSVLTRFGIPSSAITERHEQDVQRYLAAYARGSLPKIPKDYIEDFPQGLGREKAAYLDALGDPIAAHTSIPVAAPTKCDNKKGDNQQRAIMELVQTEANYIKVLEMMIDVHVAVFLDLNKPLTGANMPSQSSARHSYHASGEILRRRRRDSIFEKIKSSHRRRIRSQAELNLSSRASTSNLYNGTLYETVHSQNFGSANSLTSISTPQRPQIIPDVSDIFGNLGHIYRVNVKFWEDCFQNCFSGTPSKEPNLTVAKLKASFIQFETYFEPYVEYLRDCYSIISYVKDLEARNRLFAAYTEWTTYHNTLNQRESLTSLLRKPFQRIMQYGLLLQRIKDETRDPQEMKDLDQMLSVVNEFVKKIESEIPEHEAKLKLEKFLQRIEGYSYLKGLPDGLRQYADGLDELKARLRQPVALVCKTKYRMPLAELPARVKFCNGKSIEGICVLLTDQILICKEMRNNISLSVCRPPISLLQTRLVKKSGYFAIIERGELNYIKEVYTIIADSIPLKAWSEKVRQAKVSRIAHKGNQLITFILEQEDFFTNFSRNMILTFK
uniref:Pleckstrin homology domain-containing family G member 6 n=1 Tax=Schistocephalus solidus TaxID=70667 RepID=A0A0X3NHR1_SCHSO